VAAGWKHSGHKLGSGLDMSRAAVCRREAASDRARARAGEELRLVIVGYIRPERNFDSLDALVARIHEDAAATREALRSPRLAAAAADAFLQPAPAAGAANGSSAC